MTSSGDVGHTWPDPLVDRSRTAGARRVAYGPQIEEDIVGRAYEVVDRMNHGYLCHVLATGLLSWGEPLHRTMAAPLLGLLRRLPGLLPQVLVAHHDALAIGGDHQKLVGALRDQRRRRRTL